LIALEELPSKKITDIFTDINTDKLSRTELKKIIREENIELTKHPMVLRLKRMINFETNYLWK